MAILLATTPEPDLEHNEMGKKKNGSRGYSHDDRDAQQQNNAGMSDAPAEVYPPDQELNCAEGAKCPNGGKFIHSGRDQAFYAKNGFTPPKRCKPCRDANKARRDSKQAQS